jgi:Fur family ferric uptake transcriptional regulator
MVVTALRHADGHRTAAQVLEEVQHAYPYVDISTVYRTMAVLKELHLVSETDMGAGELAYEWSADDPHHHLICRDCGTVQQLDPEALDKLAQALSGDYGFRADIEHIAIFGLCRTCQATSA